MTQFFKNDTRVFHPIATDGISEFNTVDLQNVGLYVGSFDPPHLMHQTIITVLKNLNLDSILIVPTFKHCVGKQVSDFYHRINMILLAFNDIRNVFVYDVERQINEYLSTNQNFTDDTINFIEKRYPNIKLHLVMGSDLFRDFKVWRNQEYYLNCSMYIISRKGYPANINIEINQKLLKNGNCEILLEDKPLDNVSSTLIRHNIIEKKYNKLNGIISKKVFEYILNNDDILTVYQNKYDNYYDEQAQIFGY